MFDRRDSKGKSMHKYLLKCALGGALSILFCSAQANPLLPVQNLTFSQFTGFAPKTIFSAVNPVGWTGGTGLISIDAPGTATVDNQTHGNAYAVYGPFANPPPGGNFIQADGNPVFETSFNQVLTGLAIGQTYTLTFWQAAGQQQGFTGATTEQWIVALGGTGFVLCHGCGTDPTYGTVDTYSNPGADIATTALMSTPSQGVTGWEQVSVDLTATAATETLSFLAWGNNGSEVNLPPTVFLAGVNSPALPEPGSLALVGIALLGLTTTAKKGKRNRDSAAA
jgi:hypothetical protein